MVVTQVRDQGSKVAEGEGGGLAENAGIELTVEALVGVDIQGRTFAFIVGTDTESGARLQSIDAVHLPASDSEVERETYLSARSLRTEMF